MFHLICRWWKRFSRSQPSIEQKGVSEMSLSHEISIAVKAQLVADGKLPDPNQVMQDPPYSYNTRGKMDTFVSNVQTRLTPKHIVIDESQLDLDKCMTDTELQLEADIDNASSGGDDA
jgi:hypothetical protein